MAIDPTTPVGREFVALASRLKAKRPRLERLAARRAGNGPLPEGAAGMHDAYRMFQRRARSNYAGLSIDATRELMVVNGFRTAVDGDDDGDARAWEFWAANALDVGSAEVHDDMLTMGDGFAMVGAPDPQTGVPNITAEDPREVITRHDPARPRVVLSAFKTFLDDWSGDEVAYLITPGEVRVATRKVRDSSDGPEIDDAGSWKWDESRFARFEPLVVPVIRFQNRRGEGDFEPHIDLLDRIDYTILQRLVITAMQAYRQRAIKGDLPATDSEGNQIDYSALFRPGAGALWELPAGVDLWESQQTSFQDILVSVKDDVRELSAVMQLPMATFMPDGANQTAEGASYQRESRNNKVADRDGRAGASWEQVISTAFLFAGDPARADLAKLRTDWQPPERYSLSERASAWAQTGDLPSDRRLLDVWGVSPAQLPEIRAQMAADQLLAAAAAPPQQADAQPAA